VEVDRDEEDGINVVSMGGASKRESQAFIIEE
jgi:hypothetical protein